MRTYTGGERSKAKAAEDNFSAQTHGNAAISQKSIHAIKSKKTSSLNSRKLSNSGAGNLA